MDGVHFDGLTRTLARAASRRQTLKGLVGTAMGIGLLGPAASLASASSGTSPSRADIANTSAQQLSRMPDLAALRKRGLPVALLGAIETDHRLLVSGLSAQTWSDSQLLDFRNMVSASVQQHRTLTAGMAPAASTTCFSNCASEFVTNVGTCGTGLGGLLCEVLDLVAFDLCALGCILGGLGL
jgi:hypothetical protein